MEPFDSKMFKATQARQSFNTERDPTLVVLEQIRKCINFEEGDLQELVLSAPPVQVKLMIIVYILICPTFSFFHYS